MSPSYKSLSREGLLRVLTRSPDALGLDESRGLHVFARLLHRNSRNVLVLGIKQCVSGFQRREWT